MVTYGFTFIPVNLLFLSLGVLLLLFAGQKGITLPEVSDNILPILAEKYLGFPVLIFFTLGIVAASFSSADSALASLTTAVCVDLLEVDKESPEKATSVRKKVHIGVSIIFGIIIILINYLGESSIINAIYKIASYTYGPLLGLFAFGLFSKIGVKDKLVPYVCIVSPILCYIIEVFLKARYDYTIGYELLMLNGLLTAIGLLLISKQKSTTITN